MSLTLRLILGDQLNPRHSWFATPDPGVVYVLMEVAQETGYVRHHVQKVVAFFAAMRSFAADLRAQGHTVRYLRLGDPANQQNFGDNVRALVAELGCQRLEYQLPDEYRLDEYLHQLAASLPIATQAVDSEHFLTQRLAVREVFKGKKMYLLETFYRQMRQKHQLLLDDQGQPVGGRWNLDAENRKKFDGKANVPSQPSFFSPQKQKLVEEIYQEITQMGVETIGRFEAAQFDWYFTVADARQQLDFFVKRCLPHFGTYEDAMDTRFEVLFHSRLSFALNVKLLHPLEVVQAAIGEWQRRPSEISLPQIEGFVRQIVGWREYMRGIYWDKMPGFALLNFFDHHRPLPSWYWTGEVKMNCLRHAIGQSLDRAYAHHIQRLMVTGAFANLAGIHPDELDAWYLGIYADAIEWVEITNTRGMSQYADGGIVGTKPYVGSANYINKMSNYCQLCAYEKDKKYGPNACPFNSLYWHFYDRHRDKLANNPRIGMAYVTWDKQLPDEKAKILAQAERYLAQIEEL